MIRMLLLILMALGNPARAQDAPVPVPLPAALAGVPDVLADRLRRAPDDFVADAGMVILGYGTAGGITADGLATYVQVVEAAARGNVLRRMVEADLNADGTIAPPEIAVIALAAEAGVRGRIMLNHAAADLDGDGAVIWDEAVARADVLAADALSGVERERLAAMMTLDLNADGTLTFVEVEEVARLMQGS
jgi:hypothetical protein